jgi:hypothetical protein
MNGAELPCGTVIGVQPADADYKPKSNKNVDRRSSRRPPSPSNGTVTAARANGAMEATRTTPDAASSAVTASGRFRGADDKTPKDGGDDLDDFFASLE